MGEVLQKVEMKKEDTNNTTTRSQSKSRLAILELAHMMSVPMSLTAILSLKVPEAMWQDGSNTPLSASQILSIIRPHGGADAENLQRILRLLTSYDIFDEHLCSKGERKYSLSEIGKTLVDDEQGLSYAYFMLQHHQDALMRSWALVGEAVVDPKTEPFVKANGEGAIEYYTKRPDAMNLIHKSLAGMAGPMMREILQVYDGFEGVDTLVDVGGYNGVSLRMIMDKFPSIPRGVNFDLPDVVASAPHIPGVTHVGGDAFTSVPPGDAIFIKWVLLAWTDEECKVVMQNCHKALPENGKLIVCEPVVPELTDESRRTRALLGGDVFIMTMYRTKGKHRTEEQFKQLGISSGFPRFRAFYVDTYLTVLEFQK
ncbi:caffeic acid 3-O-methyltransferase-like [Abrus precatorius]|uniref:Caffeic acid 3-O-methyltransferase-like n=1 Tax=Abrus precatorius TaxID=3816 RepID=A0A8B8K4M1_ABRPR|nr:caffeic acid 3-O-methyltransferase-like [Abrus precatorius]